MMHLDRLPNQRPNEQLVLFLRRHWIAPLSIILIGIALLGVPAAAAFTFSETVANWFSHPIGGPLLTLFAAVYVLSVWLIVALEFVDYYLDTWIVTTERIINIEQQGLYRRTASELHLANIQDVTSEVKGPLRTILHYGDVLIQTAAETARFDFESIPNPDRVKDKILRLVEEDKKRHAAETEKPA